MSTEKIYLALLISSASLQTIKAMEQSTHKRSYSPHPKGSCFKSPSEPHLLTSQENSSIKYYSSDSVTKHINELLEAVTNNDISKIKKMLNYTHNIGYNPNITDKDENSLLILATRNNNNEIVEILLKKKELLPNKKNKWGNTALHCAAFHKHESVLQTFLHDPRIDFSLKNAENRTARDILTITAAGDENIELRANIFARTMLEAVVFNLQLMKLSNNAIEDKVNFVKQLFQEDINKNSTPLPKHAQFPTYATNEFIKTIILRSKPEQIELPLKSHEIKEK
jgi:hypothetical protein